MLLAVKVGQQLGECVAAIKVSGIPLLSLFKLGTLAPLGIVECRLEHGLLLRFNRHSLIGLVNILEHHLHRRAVDNDVMIVDKQVIVRCVMEQTHTEQATAINVERLHQRRLQGLHVGHFLDVQFKRLLTHVNALHGFARVINFYSCEQCGMRFDGRFYRAAQALAIERAVYGIEIGQIVAGFSQMVHTLHIEAILYRRKGG